MKKIIKILALVLAMCMLCISLTGCDFIDEMRECQGFFDESGNIVLSSGTEYIPIDVPEQVELNSDYDYTGTITERDVPVLLSNVFGKRFYMSADKIFIEAYTEKLESYTYYCRADSFEHISNILETGYSPIGYLYSYYDYIAQAQRDYIFSEDEVKLVNQLLKSINPTVLSDEYKIDWDVVVDIYSHSQESILIRYEFGIGILNGNYKIIVNNTTVYDIPLEYTEVFEKITEKHINHR